MEETAKERIAAARCEVHRSGLEPEHKDALQARLDHAAKCSNGTKDKLAAMAQDIADGIVHDVLTEVRQPVRTRQIVSDEIRAHLDSCPMRVAAAMNAPGPITSRLGAVGAAFCRLSVEWRFTIVMVFLWALDRFGVENILRWARALCG